MKKTKTILLNFGIATTVITPLITVSSLTHNVDANKIYNLKNEQKKVNDHYNNPVDPILEQEKERLESETYSAFGNNNTLPSEAILGGTENINKYIELPTASSFATLTIHKTDWYGESDDVLGILNINASLTNKEDNAKTIDVILKYDNFAIMNDVGKTLIAEKDRLEAMTFDAQIYALDRAWSIPSIVANDFINAGDNSASVVNTPTPIEAYRLSASDNRIHILNDQEGILKIAYKLIVRKDIYVWVNNVIITFVNFNTSQDYNDSLTKKALKNWSTQKIDPASKAAAVTPQDMKLAMMTKDSPEKRLEFLREFTNDSKLFEDSTGVSILPSMDSDRIITSVDFQITLDIVATYGEAPNQSTHMKPFTLTGLNKKITTPNKEKVDGFFSTLVKGVATNASKVDPKYAVKILNNLLPSPDAQLLALRIYLGKFILPNNPIGTDMWISESSVGKDGESIDITITVFAKATDDSPNYIKSTLPINYSGFKK